MKPQKLLTLVLLITFVRSGFGQTQFDNPSVQKKEYCKSIEIIKIIFTKENSKIKCRYNNTDEKFVNYCLSKNILIEYNGKLAPSASHNKIQQNDIYTEIEFTFPFIKESFRSINFFCDDDTCFNFTNIQVTNNPAEISTEEVLNNESIIQLNKIGLGTAIIISKIKTTRSNFDVTTNALIQLKGAGIPDEIVAAMIEGAGNKNNALFNSNNTIKTFKIGDYYQGGHVFFIDQSGKHGLIAAQFNETDEKVMWGRNGDTYALSTNDGQENTRKIIDYLTTHNKQVEKSAAYRCDKLIYEGFSDWYLPAIDELKLLYDQKALMKNFIIGDYCSSTELKANDAYSIHNKPQKRIIFYYNKDNYDYYVRCIRKF